MIELFPFPLDSWTKHEDIYKIQKDDFIKEKIFLDRVEIIKSLINTSENKYIFVYWYKYKDLILNWIQESTLMPVEYDCRWNKYKGNIIFYKTSNNSKIILMPHISCFIKDDYEILSKMREL